MAKVDVLDILRAKKMDPLEFHFESLWIPPMNMYLSQQDVDELRNIATSARLSSKIRQKYEMIDNIMTRRGFKRFSAGTNRVVYRFLDDTRFLVKIAVDKVGMQDNPLEFKNQFLLQPYVTKMFYVSPCGTVGFSERVLPIKNRAEFREIASDVFDILVHKILGVYVVEDVGTKYFMNWGIRTGFGPVLLDYPYVYKLDGDKLYCNWISPETGSICDGEIDYDEGFNHLVCSRCGKVYLATNLRDDTADNNLIIRKGGNEMRVVVKRGDQVIYSPIPTDEVMKPDPKPTTLKCGAKSPVVRIKRLSNYIQPDEEKTMTMIESDSKKEDVEVTTSVAIDEPVITSTFIKPNPVPVADNVQNDDEEDHNSEVNESEENTESNSETDEFNSNYDNDEFSDDEEDDEDDDPVFASDIEIERQNNQARMERNNPNIITGNSHKKNKKNKNKRNNFIPSGDYYRR